MRGEEAVQDRIKTSLALSFNNEEKTGETEITKSLQNDTDTTTVEQWKIRTLKILSTLFQKIVKAITF